MRKYKFKKGESIICQPTMCTDPSGYHDKKNYKNCIAVIITVDNYFAGDYWPYKISIDNKRWWSEDELKSALKEKLKMLG